MPQRIRRTALMKRAGPYRVVSHLGGLLSVYPHWLGMDGKPSWRRETEADAMEAGGPGVFSRMGLAYDVQRWLNVPHDDSEAVIEATEHLWRGDLLLTQLGPQDDEEE